MMKEYDDNHPAAILAKNIYQNHPDVSMGLKITPWEICVAMSNATAMILADLSGPHNGDSAVTRDEAIERMDSLHEVMKVMYYRCTSEGRA